MKKLLVFALALAMLLPALACAEGALSFAGRDLSFETTDVDGNPVSSGEIYGANRITLVNFWATWCGPCVGELAALADVHTQLQAEGCGVVGVLLDGDTPEGLEAARRLMADNGTNYPVLVPSGNLDALQRELMYVPTTVFVDGTGAVVGNAIVGAMVRQYLPAARALANSLPEAEGEAAAPEYRVIVTDAAGNPVPGAAVQFCSADTCTLGKTDAEGVAAFRMPEAPGYTVHVLKVPEGYAGDDTEYPVPETYGDLEIVLQPAQ